MLLSKKINILLMLIIKTKIYSFLLQVHEMDLLPKQMCHQCSYKLEEFYNFYVNCAKTDTEFKSQLSWMRNENLEEKIITPMVKMNKFKIKTVLLDNNDVTNTNNVFGHIGENSLLFPTSILQHNFDPSIAPALSCVNCQCVCNRHIKINQSSSEQVKVVTNIKSKRQICNSNVASNISNKINEFNKFKNINKNFFFNKSFIKNSNVKKKYIKETLTINHDNNECNKSNNIHNVNILKCEKLGRALRPRKGSVDYMGPRKKNVVSNMKTKLKSNLSLVDPTLITPVNTNLLQDNLIYPSPIIKLEKVDKTIRTLRTRKNLEEFNRRLKEFKHKHSKQRMENQSKKILLRKGNCSSKILQQNSSDIKEKKENYDRKSLQTKDTSIKKLQIQKSDKKQQYFNYMSNNTCDNVNIMELKIKHEIVNKIPENKSLKQLQQKKTVQVDQSKSQNVSKLTVDRYPLCTIVKLEKDYTRNVDYPRIKIKRHLAMSNHSNSQNSVLEILPRQNSIFELDRKSCNNIKSNISPKNLRSKEKKLKFSNKNKSEKISKKKNKNLNVVNVKRILLKKSTSVISQPDLKRYCEDCDICFRNKELYKLHPCYQK
jgi:hypothetical protein